MRARCLGWVVLTAVACADEQRASTQLQPELGRDATTPDVTADRHAHGPDASEQAPAEAGSSDAAVDVCSAGIQRAGNGEYKLELSALCAMLAHDGLVSCPESRRTLIETSVDCAPERTSFPTLRRHCGTDIFYRHYSAPLLNVSWTFDSDGRLIAATVASMGQGFLCGRGTYVAGPPFATCDEPDVECRLCESGPARDAECPDDVVAALPGKSCETLAVAPGCACESPGATSPELPPEGAACGPPDACPRCQSGTCWASCVCALDGAFRWNVDCTE